jgi:very-short-patch-repair endonuclease
MCIEYDIIDNNINKESEIEFEMWLNTLPSRLDGSMRRSIGNFATVINSMNNAGSNTPKQVWAKLFKQREELMKEVSGILPAWCVTNLSAKGSLPLIKGLFDILIIDEASQCDIPSALPLMYRSKKVVIIGDPNQLQHITSIPTERSLTLMDSNGLSENKYLSFEYTNNSLFHCATSFIEDNSLIMLKEHFRSHEDIINFSNKKWYNGNLTVETDYRKLYPLLNGMGRNVNWIETNGAITQEEGSGAYIDNEINEVVQTVSSIMNDPNFTGDIGVVTPFRLQANRIRQKLIALDINGNMKRTHLIVDTSIKFQGDEKDVMIYSPVIAPSMPRGVKYYIESTPNLLNVSLTRAKSQLIIVGNKAACINSGISMMREFAEYVNGLELMNNPTEQLEVIESQYQQKLSNVLLADNILTIPNYKVNQYKMDLAYIENEKKIDIEIEGESQSKEWDEDKLKREMIRNLRLNKLGWKVVRIWNYEIRDDLQNCVERIKRLII